MNFDEITERSLPYANSSKVCQDFVSLIQHWLSKLQIWATFCYNLRSFFPRVSCRLRILSKEFFQKPIKVSLLLLHLMQWHYQLSFWHLWIHMIYKAKGIRLDSGDLAYFSIEARKFFCAIEEEFGVSNFGRLNITASNDINEATLDALNKQGHEVDAFGIGTHLVTCYTQPALGGVYKLVQINGQPRIKLSEDLTKVTIPCKKQCYRLYGKDGYALVDLMIGENEPPPKAGERILCRHPFTESKRAYVIPRRVEQLYKCFWAGKSGVQQESLPSLEYLRQHCQQQLAAMRPDHMRGLNPTPYKVSVSGKLYEFIHFLWLNEAPVGELH
ncbi:hypothetical protein O6H91_16G002700 [Diphasiastrum complanatum]|uniref:Uncharacterized protein n=1 Tax=Diphasiastrum complanatum TaxID=34168 RepID=A0ACC2B9G2_DIPCM|nr:hypothetical protein O6H91_16G002700 [Diphasiastrum complanatum]